VPRPDHDDVVAAGAHGLRSGLAGGDGAAEPDDERRQEEAVGRERRPDRGRGNPREVLDRFEDGQRLQSESN